MLHMALYWVHNELLFCEQPQDCLSFRWILRCVFSGVFCNNGVLNEVLGTGAKSRLSQRLTLDGGTNANCSGVLHRKFCAPRTEQCQTVENAAASRSAANLARLTKLNAVVIPARICHPFRTQKPVGLDRPKEHLACPVQKIQWRA